MLSKVSLSLSLSLPPSLFLSLSVKSLYDVVKARDRDGASPTESIHCLRGVKQGDVCSPILFSLFINELAIDIIKGGKHGAILTSTLVEIFILPVSYTHLLAH